MLGLHFPKRPLQFVSETGGPTCAFRLRLLKSFCRRYRFRTMWSVQFEQLNRDDPELNDGWSFYYLPSV